MTTPCKLLIRLVDDTTQCLQCQNTGKPIDPLLEPCEICGQYHAGTGTVGLIQMIPAEKIVATLSRRQS